MVRARLCPITLSTLASPFRGAFFRARTVYPDPSDQRASTHAERTMIMFPVVFESVGQAGSALKRAKLLTLRAQALGRRT